MENAMYCRQCQETNGGTACTAGGRCGKPPVTANMMDELISLLSAVAITVEGRTNVTREVSRFICRALFATLTNTNFNPDRIQALIDEAKRTLCRLDSDVKVPQASLPDADENEDVKSLREILLYGMKGISAYAFHALADGREDVSVYDFVLKGLVAFGREHDPSKLVRLVLECGHAASVVMALLDSANCEAFGSPGYSRVRTSVGKRPGILVSGHDYKDLEELLDQTEGKNVDVYTHGEMLPAHYYPLFKKYKHLVGNYGSAWWQQADEFTKFNGAILMTTNCIIPVRPAYKDRIFTTGMAGYPNVPHITHRHAGGRKDFSIVIDKALTCPPPEQIDDVELVGGFAHNQVCAVADKIVDAVKAGKISRFIVMAGCDGRMPEREYYTKVALALPKDTVILTAGCAKYRFNKLNLGEISGIPRVLDAGQCNDSYSLIRIAFKLKELTGVADVNDLPISFDISWYEQKAVAVFLALCAFGFRNIRLGPTLPAFVSKNVMKVLVDRFGIKPCTTPEEDVKAMMAGK